MNELQGRCVNCRHWTGTRERARRVFRERGQWYGLGECNKDPFARGLIESYYDKTPGALYLYKSDFGCVNWEEE